MTNLFLILLILLPSLGGLLSLLSKNPRRMLIITSLSTLAFALCAAFPVVSAFRGSVISSQEQWLRLDALSAYTLLVMTIVFVLSGIYAINYYQAELDSGHLQIAQIQTHCVLWSSSLSAMALVLMANNLAIMWAGIELTTLLTAFLICLHKTEASLEATWKYLLICSVGVGLAFIGTVLIGSAATHWNSSFMKLYCGPRFVTEPAC